MLPASILLTAWLVLQMQSPLPAPALIHMLLARPALCLLLLLRSTKYQVLSAEVVDYAC